MVDGPRTSFDRVPRSKGRKQWRGRDPAMSSAVSVPLLGEDAALLPWSRIENRAVDFASGVANEGDPRVIATFDVELIPRKNRHGRRPALVKIKHRPAACCVNDKLAIRDTDLKLNTV